MLLFGCHENQTELSNTNSKEVDVLSDNELATKEIKVLKISENSLNQLSLPFPEEEVIDTLRVIFSDYLVNKEIGYQDGPDVTLYSVKGGDRELAYFKMDWENDLKIDAIHFKSSFIRDQYGLSVGDTFEEIKKLRGNDLRVVFRDHLRTHVSIDGSKIQYEIISDEPVTNRPDSDLKIPNQDQLNEWKIKQIIWQN